MPPPKHTPHSRLLENAVTAQACRRLNVSSNNGDDHVFSPAACVYDDSGDMLEQRHLSSRNDMLKTCGQMCSNLSHEVHMQFHIHGSMKPHCGHERFVDNRTIDAWAMLYRHGYRSINARLGPIYDRCRT